MNYYNILGVQPDASPEEIKRAYRKLAMEHHPDRGGDADRFKQITEAYETLKDVNKKQQYDNPGWRNVFDFADFDQSGQSGFDSFEDILRRARAHNAYARAQQAQRNPDGIAEINISLQQAYHGTDYLVDLGYTKELLSIQAGVRDGTRYRIKEKGPSRYKDIPPGDLIVKVNVVTPHNIARDNNDLYMRFEINAIQAMTGCEIDLDHVSGRTIVVKIPAGTQPGSKLRIKGFGMPDPVNKNPGDLYAIIQIVIPKVTDSTHIQQLNNIYKEVK
jgi:curved DNA-binding protein